MLHDAAVALLVASLVVGAAGIVVAFRRSEEGRPYPQGAVTAGIGGAIGSLVALILLVIG
jgi:hypothetical protein